MSKKRIGKIIMNNRENIFSYLFNIHTPYHWNECTVCRALFGRKLSNLMDKDFDKYFSQIYNGLHNLKLEKIPCDICGANNPIRYTNITIIKGQFMVLCEKCIENLKEISIMCVFNAKIK